MPQTAISGETATRFGWFLAVFVIVAIWEIVAPRRTSSIPRRFRWPSNLGIVVLDALAVRLLLPATATGIAILAQERGWGLLSVLPIPGWAPGWAAVVVAVALLDLAIYAQHVVFHAVPGLWRLHRMHHADVAFDVTTGLRFHPTEILLSTVIKCAAIAALGAPPLAVLVFEITLNAASMFNHGNIRLHPALDALARRILVTPDMHRVHHSVLPEETNSNFGFGLSWWDRLFGTYRPRPAAGHLHMAIGLESFRDISEARLDRMLSQPLRDG